MKGTSVRYWHGKQWRDMKDQGGHQTEDKTDCHVAVCGDDPGREW